MVVGLGNYLLIIIYLLVVDVVFVRKRKVSFIMNAIITIVEHCFVGTFFLLHEHILLARNFLAEIAPDSSPLYSPRVQ